MQITFLIGNGFDLNLGLQTTYEDFLKVYLKKKKGDKENIKIFKDYIKKDIDTWANAEEAFGEYSEKFKSSEDFIDCWEDFCENLSSYLSNQEWEFDFRLKEYGYNGCTGYSQYKINKIKKNVEKILYHFCGFLSKGMIRQSKFKELNNMSKDEIYKTVAFRFINFNYTNMFQRIIAEHLNGSDDTNGTYFNNFCSKPTIKYIHNKIGEPIILGVADNSQIANSELFEGNDNKKFIIKSSYDNYLEADLYKDALDDINNSDIIITYGLSIGKTDKYCWQKIHEWLKKDKNNNLLICGFNKDKTFAKRTSDKIKDEYINKFLEFADESICIQDIKSQVYFTDTNIFEDIKEIAIQVK